MTQGRETGGDVLLLGDMINTGTYVRLLRHLGIALIFAPEPLTTPFGVAFILVARHLSKRLEASRDKRLREMVQYYLAHSSLSTNDADGKSGGPSPVKRHSLSEERPILGQITGSRSFEASSSVRKARHELHDSAASGTSDMRNLSPLYKYGSALSATSTGPQKVIHHTIDIEWLSRRYECANSAVAHSSWATTSRDVQGITHHSVNMGLLSPHSGTGTVGQLQIKYHTINMARLRQRYGSAASCTTVYRALRDNNHYYDLLSRRNVIGGYEGPRAPDAVHGVGGLKKAGSRENRTVLAASFPVTFQPERPLAGQACRLAQSSLKH
jgi:hypothetical protein